MEEEKRQLKQTSAKKRRSNENNSRKICRRKFRKKFQLLLAASRKQWERGVRSGARGERMEYSKRWGGEERHRRIGTGTSNSVTLSSGCNTQLEAVEGSWTLLGAAHFGHIHLRH